MKKNVPDRKDAAGLGKASLLLDAADSLLENGRHLGRRGLRVGGICAGLEGGNGGCGISLSRPVSLTEFRERAGRGKKSSSFRPSSQGQATTSMPSGKGSIELLGRVPEPLRQLPGGGGGH